MPIRGRERAIEALRPVLEADPRLAYALLFGSLARGTVNPHSDVDVAVGLRPGVTFGTFEMGDLLARLEGVAGAPVDVVLLDEAAPGLAYRIFRDGHVVFVGDRRALSTRRARAILEYLDFRPVEEMFARSILSSAAPRPGDGR